MDSIALLERLVAFPTISSRSNLELIVFLESFLTERGAAVRRVPDASGLKANLFATIGPADRPGIVLSGHTDVVPVEGQDWSSDPFTLVERQGRLFGRGAADMKGFVACMVRAADRASKQALQAPLHLAFSYDEEVGCLGVRTLLDALVGTPPQAKLCIVGEPTLMGAVIGHKGKLAARATCLGVEGHSALAPRALNAIHLAADFVQALRRRQDRIAEAGAKDMDYDIPYSTLHAGVIGGGTALNIVPNRTTIDFEIRTIGADSAEAILDAIRADAAAICAPYRDRFPGADIRIEVTNVYPGLDTPKTSAAVTFVQNLLGTHDSAKVAFGTEAGYFDERLKLASVVCGPGSIEQAHKPDEFIARDQIAACDRFMDRLVASLVDGLEFASAPAW